MSRTFVGLFASSFTPVFISDDALILALRSHHISDCLNVSSLLQLMVRVDEDDLMSQLKVSNCDDALDTALSKSSWLMIIV